MLNPHALALGEGTPGVGDGLQQLEQEVKLETSPGWSLPDLSGVLPGVKAVPLRDLALDATYYDTSDLHLARHKVTLRFRRETEMTGVGRGVREAPSTEIWTLKLPSASDSTALTRTEASWAPEPSYAGPDRKRPARRASRGRSPGLQSRAEQPEGGPVHPEAARFVQAMTLGRALEPVAHLSTTRRRTELRTSDGRRLAEIDQDSVVGADLLSRREVDVTHDAYADVRFSEVEVELAEGSSLEVLEAVVDKLEAAGAFRSSRSSKLATVLALGRAGDADRTAAQPQEKDDRQDIAMSTVLAQQARSCLEAVLSHDPAIRLGDPDPEHVHRSRVATRRLRTVFRAYSSLVVGRLDDASGPQDVTEAWFTGLGQELKWLGHSLGTVRDSDVRLLSLEDGCATLPATDAAGSTVLLARAREQQRVSHEELRETVATDRYFQILRALDALASGPGRARISCQLSSGGSCPNRRPREYLRWPNINGVPSTKRLATWVTNPPTKRCTACGSRRSAFATWPRWPAQLSVRPIGPGPPPGPLKPRPTFRTSSVSSTMRL